MCPPINQLAESLDRIEGKLEFMCGRADRVDKRLSDVERRLTALERSPRHSDLLTDEAVTVGITLITEAIKQKSRCG